MDILGKMRDLFGGLGAGSGADLNNMISVDELNAFGYEGQTYTAPSQTSIWDGGKFFGGFGPTQLQIPDYWTLRARSAQLFSENLYAKGLIRRLVTNEIGPGLMPEATPVEEVLGLAEDSLANWTEDVENRYDIWARCPQVVDWLGEDTMGGIQRNARREALIEGDILVVLRYNRTRGVPQIQLIRGSRITTPWAEQNQLREGHKIVHGVEFDRQGRQTAYWVQQPNGIGWKRLPAYGEKSGRRLAWLVYGTEKRVDDVRGMPLLGIVMQSLKEIDRYRDSAQRKAVINSILAMYIKKTDDKPGTLPMSNGAVRKDSVEIMSPDGAPPRKFSISSQIPGVIAEELQTGEEPVGFNSNGTDTSFPVFEDAVLGGIAWANEMPPEILTMRFSNNYSASQAAINEFKIYLNKIWCEFGEQFCTPIYKAWLIGELLDGKIQANGLLDSWRDSSQYEIFGAWTMVEWYGAIKPSTDMLKQAKGSQILVNEGWSTNAREARINTGTKYSRNIKRIVRENEQKAAALRPILELNKEFGDQQTSAAMAALNDSITALNENLEGLNNGEISSNINR